MLMHKPKRHYPIIFFTFFLISFLLSATAIAGTSTPPGCAQGDCGLRPGKLEPYPHFVIGPIVHIADEDEMRRLYRWAKSSENGAIWQDLPDSEEDYLRRNQRFVLANKRA